MSLSIPTFPSFTQIPKIHHPQMLGMEPARVLLPLNLPQDEPIYVNPKQYRAILRRREYRAKLEAQNKLFKARKPYLHESRHLHALKRARGSGGRFVNTKKIEESKPSTANGQDIFGSSQLHFATNMLESEVCQPEHCKEGASTTSCSDLTSASNSVCLCSSSKNSGSLFTLLASVGTHTLSQATGYTEGWLRATCNLENHHDLSRLWVIGQVINIMAPAC
ncbi:Nuclear transcription factor Y subunit A-6 like [Actinidia chinensis var. chinensis]|uniref:Nuclear transcription factor Y subunit n=1 Tax=Actinidia chinensis var. chinensis TaxID=1590841 RepID=A0A2R6PT12_ACTCC|nr:Nuclear transcription factor Y subunit A-6 like [Actinidia chinensis var. chinensis]